MYRFRLPNYNAQCLSINLFLKTSFFRFYCLANVLVPTMAFTLPARIDVHSHFLPSFYQDALRANGHSHPDGMPAIPPWSPEDHLELMDAANIKKSIISISSPGTNLDSNAPSSSTIELTRQCNAYAAKLKGAYPNQIGFWASLPLPDVNATLAEIDTAVSEGCDGFSLLTNYHGEYLGDTKFDPIFKKLNQIGATIFIHPTAPCIHSSTTNASTKAVPFGSQYPIPIFEFLFDTARTVINLFYSGTVDQCPNVKFIIPHSGGTLPPLITRFTAFGALVPGTKTLDPEQVRKQMTEQFYFDLAGTIFDGDTGGRGQLKAFVEGFDISFEKLLYGSDFPFTKLTSAMTLANRMKDGLEHLFTVEERKAIYELNAIKLLSEGKLKKLN